MMERIRAYFIGHHLARAEDSFEAAKIRLVFSFFATYFLVALAFIPYLFTYKIPLFTYINLGGYALYLLPFVLLRVTRSYEIPSFLFAMAIVLAASANSVFNNGLLTPNISVWYFIAVAFGAYTLRPRYTVSLVVIMYVCLSNIDWLRYHDRLSLNPYFSVKANLDATPFIMVLSFPLILKLLLEYVRSKQRAISELKEVIREKDAILGVVAHDLRNPVGAAVSCMELVRLDIRRHKETEALRIVDVAEDSCRRALGHIGELLEAASLREDPRQLTRAEEDAGPFILSVVETFRPLALKKGIGLNFELPSEPMMIFIDRRRFSRVLDNLISNAVKFTGEGGRIDVSAARSAGRTVIAVSDTGIGIPESMRDTLFNEFTPAARKGTDNERSTGLGMSISKRIVELHGGEIRFESTEGKGTIFYVILPDGDTPAAADRTDV